MLKKRYQLAFASMLLIASLYIALQTLLKSDWSRRIVTSQTTTPPNPSPQAKELLIHSSLGQYVIFPTLEPILSPDFPEGVSPNGFVPLEPSELSRGKQEAQSRSGVGTWFRTTWRENTTTPLVFWGTEKQPFVAMVDQVSYQGNKAGWIVLCLLDFEQIPCGPGNKLTRYFPDNETASFMLQTPPLEKDFHQIDLIQVADYGDEPVERWITQLSVKNDGPYHIAVEGNVQIPDVHYIVPTQTQEAFGFRLVDWHTKVYPLVSNPTSYQEIEDPIAAGPSQEVSLYLHLNNPYSVAYDYAVIAVLDRERTVPLYFEGEEQAPLYVRNKAGAWQILQVTLIAPAEPGHHTVQLFSFPFPYTPAVSVEKLSSSQPGLAEEIVTGVIQPGTLIDLNVSAENQ
jgi:hypothetical protein